MAVTPAGAQFGPSGYEGNLPYLASLAAIVMGGSGPFAVDRLIGKRDDMQIRNGRIIPGSPRSPDS
jgi:putative oxidoreductase